MLYCHLEVVSKLNIRRNCKSIHACKVFKNIRINIFLKHAEKTKPKLLLWLMNLFFENLNGFQLSLYSKISKWKLFQLSVKTLKHNLYSFRCYAQKRDVREGAKKCFTIGILHCDSLLLWTLEELCTHVLIKQQFS